MASKAEVQVEVASPAEKFWAAIRDSTDLFPKIFPQKYKSIEIVEGDGRGAGSIRLINYAEEIPLVKLAKERIEAVDEPKKVVTYSVIEGDLLSFYRTFRPTLEVCPTENGALLKWTVEYEKANEEVPGPELIQEMAVATFKELDAYLLKN